MKAETMLLGQILTDNDVYYKESPKEWWFTDAKNRKIFQAIEQLIQDGARADIVNTGTRSGYEDEVSQLTEDVITTANARYYAREAWKNGARQRLRDLGKVLEHENTDIDELLGHIESTVDAVVSGGDEYKIERAGESMSAVIDSIEERFQNGGAIPGLETGFPQVDDIMRGLQPARMIVIGSRPSEGKSALLLNMADNISDEHKVGFVSIESSKREMLVRQLSANMKVNSQKLDAGMISYDAFGSMTHAAEKINVKGLYFYDKPNLELTELVGQCKRLVQRYKCEVLFIDYIQLVKVPSAQNKIEQVSRASMRIKDLARELQVPIVVAAQLGRASDGRRPTLGDFQHSSQIEQDADTAGLIYRRIVDKDGRTIQKTEPDEGESEEFYLCFDKNRDGRKGAIKLNFLKQYVTFKET